MIPNSFCKTKNTFHKLILQKYHNIRRVTIVLQKSTRKKMNIEQGRQLVGQIINKNPVNKSDKNSQANNWSENKLVAVRDWTDHQSNYVGPACLI